MARPPRPRISLALGDLDLADWVWLPMARAAESQPPLGGLVAMTADWRSFKVFFFYFISEGIFNILYFPIGNYT